MDRNEKQNSHKNTKITRGDRQVTRSKRRRIRILSILLGLTALGGVGGFVLKEPMYRTWKDMHQEKEEEGRELGSGSGEQEESTGNLPATPEFTNAPTVLPTDTPILLPTDTPTVLPTDTLTVSPMASSAPTLLLTPAKTALDGFRDVLEGVPCAAEIRILSTDSGDVDKAEYGRDDLKIFSKADLLVRQFILGKAYRLLISDKDAEEIINPGNQLGNKIAYDVLEREGGADPSGGAPWNEIKNLIDQYFEKKSPNTASDAQEGFKISHYRENRYA